MEYRPLCSVIAQWTIGRGALQYVERTLTTFFAKANTQFPVLLVTGARQVGKTTLLRHLVQGARAYVTLDDPLILSLAKSDPALFMQRFPAPILIDERYHNGWTPPFYYYRDKDQKEIDLLIVQDNIIYPLECKKSASPNTDAVRHFQVLDKLNLPVGPGGVVCLAPQYLPLTPSTSIIPLAAL